MMQKIHNIIFALLIFSLFIACILLAFGNENVGGFFMLLSIFLLFAEQYTMKKVVEETRNEEQEERNTYKGPSRMEFLEENLGDELIGKQEGFDEAVMGFDYHSMRLIYSVEKLIEILMAQNDWDYETAQEYAYHNIIGARGEDEPIWLECSIDVEV
jgi:hypothetical protein